MKKFLSVLMALLLVVSISAPAFADIGAPYFKEYEIRIINKDGVYLEGYSTSAYVPYDTVLTVTGDFINDYGEIQYSVSYDGVWGTVSGYDAVMLEDGVHYSEGVKLAAPKSYVVLESGVYLHKGPSNVYDTVGEEIPVGTEFDCYYAIDTSSDCAWAYTTINGVGGWIYVYQYFGHSVACKVNKYSTYGNDLYIVNVGARLFEFTDEGHTEVCGDIPVGTRLTFEYFIDSVKNIYVLVEYNGVKGWLAADGWYEEETYNKVAISKVTSFFVNSGSYPIYSELGNTASEIIGMVESNTVVKTIYSCLCESYTQTDNYDYEHFESSWYGVEVDGQLGWINITQDWDRVYIWDYMQYMTASDIEIYDTVDSYTVVDTIPGNKDLIKLVEKDFRSYVYYDGIEGWVDNDKIEPAVKSLNEYGYNEYYYHSARDYYSGRLSADYLEAIRLGKEIEFEEDDDLSPSPDEEEATTRKNRSKNDDSASFTQTQLIILCAAGVAVVAATAIITIVLISKKKKK